MFKTPKINLYSSLLFFTALYVLYRNIHIFSGDPFLLYTGSICTLLFYFNQEKIYYLVSGLTLIGAGVSQIIISNGLLNQFNSLLITIISLGLSQITIFIVIQILNNNTENKLFYYWPLGIGIILIIISLIYNKGIENLLWEYIKIYWSLALPIIIIDYKDNNNYKIDN
jgi:hypothetical protein